MARRTGFQQRVFVATAAGVDDISAINGDEIAAATEITSSLPAPVNFGGTSNSIDTSDISDATDKSVAGTFSPGTLEFETYRDSETGSELGYQTLTDNTQFVLIKFEGGAIAGDDPEPGDTYDAVLITVGTKSDVDSGRNESRRANVPCFVSGTPQRDKTIADSTL